MVQALKVGPQIESKTYTEAPVSSALANLYSLNAVEVGR